MSLQLFLVVRIFLRFLDVICCDRWVLSEGHKNYFKDWCVMNSQPTFLFLTYFFNSWTLDVYQINLNHTTLYNLALPIFEVFDWILLNMNLSSNQTVVTFLFYGRQTWIRAYLPLTWKDSVAHMRGLAVCVKEGLPFAWGFSLNKSADSYVFNCLYFRVLFFFINYLLRLYARFLMPFYLT